MSLWLHIAGIGGGIKTLNEKTLRDEIAIEAMRVQLKHRDVILHPDADANIVARVSYLYANAMLKVRES